MSLTKALSEPLTESDLRQHDHLQSSGVAPAPYGLSGLEDRHGNTIDHEHRRSLTDNSEGQLLFATEDITNPSMLGAKTGPPADRLYAVDPVGVATKTPSAA